MDDPEGRESLAENLSSAPFSLGRMTVTANADAVLYRGKHYHPELGRNFEVSDPLE